ncbi:glycosyl transferase [Verrucomicrobiaceae bacterium SCGC AG-212-N21]|nr:glycosyl transferase [Verrucomicrobiaceae bacterium SCGC AG-212-N21]
MKYVLVTPARNEGAFIDRTLASVVSQTHLPERWVIVDDGSSDDTPEIVERYVRRHPWIQLVRQQPRADRNFAGKAAAVNAGLNEMKNLSFDVVGNLDADVSFEPDYLAFVMGKFESDPDLGVGGTPFTEVDGYDSVRDSFEGQNYVAGPCQLFRYRCWCDIGGYIANKAGGIDWIAVMTARMKGWKVVAFPEKRFHHHRSMGTAQRGQLAALFSYGEKDYYLGGSALWQLFRCAYRMAKRPYLGGGVALLLGYISAAVRRVPRVVSPELMRFHQGEQMRKLKSVFRSLAHMKKIDNFALPDKAQPLR